MYLSLRAFAWGSLMFISSIAPSQQVESNPPQSGLTLSLQAGNNNNQVDFVPDLYRKSVWSAQANSKAIIGRSLSLGIDIKYIFKNGFYARLNYTSGQENSHAEVDSLENHEQVGWSTYYYNDEWNGSMKSHGLSPGCGRIFTMNRLSFFGGVSLSFFFLDGFRSFHHSRMFFDNASIGPMAAWGYTSETILKKANCMGPGLNTGFNFQLWKGLGLNGEFSWSYLFAHLSDQHLQKITVDYNYTYYQVGDAPVSYDEKLARPTMITASLGLSYYF